MIIRFPEQLFQQLKHASKNIACVINDIPCDYDSFGKIVGGIQNIIHRTSSTSTGIITQNHANTYATIIASWFTGKAYVPINPSYPVHRLKIILEEAGITDIFYAIETEETENMRANFPEIKFHITADIAPTLPFNTFPTKDKTAYILFTSGTTGRPKGVPISFGNLQAFLDGFFAMGYDLGENDRFLQMFELTFDLSVMSFLVPLIIGSSFYTLPSGMIKTLGLYQVLEDYKITFSLMVPSAIHMLKPYLDDVELPELRYSQFCGEALKSDLVKLWGKCIPNARIDNVYGPTEATIYCTSKTIALSNLDELSLKGVIGIGKPLLHVKTALFNGDKKTEAAGETAELCIAGEQVASEYLLNPEQNASKFFMHEGIRFYRTGDLVKTDESGNIYYIGRSDDQVKIQGFRIELIELELASSKVLPHHNAVAVGFQDQNDNWLLALFIQNLTADSEIIRTEIGSILPEYMIPQIIASIDVFPLNSNGKTDKNALRSLALKYL